MHVHCNFDLWHLSLKTSRVCCLSITYHTIIQATFVCLCVCVFPISSEVVWRIFAKLGGVCRWTSHLPLRGSFSKRSTGHFHFPLYYICASPTPHSCNSAFCFAAGKQQSLILRLLLHCFSTLYVGAPRNCPWGVLFLKGQRSMGQRIDGSNGSHLNGVCRWTSQLPWGVLFRKGQQVDGSTGQMRQRVNRSLSQYYIW